MEQKERLIELLESAPADFGGNRNVATLADHLLKNGVIVPPCKVGDTVYKIMDFEYTSVQVLETKVLRIEIQDAMRFYSKTVKRYRYNYIWFDSADIGKTVFLSREDAEKALAERSKE